MSDQTPTSPKRLGSPTSNGRTSSFVGTFIRRSKSNDLLGERKSSDRMRGKLEETGQQRQHNPAPSLPGLEPQPELQTFGGETYVSKGPASSSQTNLISAATTQNGASNGYERTSSMTHRGRYSYATSINSNVDSPRRFRRRKEPTPYNVLIVGARNSGKTSFLNFLKSSLALDPTKTPYSAPDDHSPPPSANANRNYISHYQEIEIDNERIGLTLWDSPGLEKNVAEIQLRGLSGFVESKFDDTFIEERKVVRSPVPRDTHIHCVFFLLDPSRLDSNIAASQGQDGFDNSIDQRPRKVGALDEDFDIQVLRTLQGKTTIIPIISKADTVTTSRMAYLKKMVLESLKRADLDPLEALNFGADDSDNEGRIDEADEAEEDEIESSAATEGRKEESESSAAVADEVETSAQQSEEQAVDTKPAQSNLRRDVSTPSLSSSMLDTGHLPFSILSPDEHTLSEKSGPVGRRFPWGFADPYNPEHCDFGNMKEICFREWRMELRAASCGIFYERWRTGRLDQKAANGARGIVAPLQTRQSSGGIPIVLDRNKKR